MPYGHQQYPDPPVSAAFATSIEQPASASIPFFYPAPCQKFGYHTTSSTASTVITHTASTMGATQQAHGYLHGGDTYPQTPCHSICYPASLSDPVPTAMPSVHVAHCFSVPEQVPTTGGRGKHKQKRGGVRTVGPPALPSGPPSNALTPTSCLAKLLSTSSRERECVNHSIINGY